MSHPRANRHSRQQVFETAFVSSRVSSSEDLDEVDRIANHPLLQHDGVGGRLKKSRSAMGGSVDRGVSAFLDKTSPGPVTSRMSRSTTLHLASVSASAGTTPVVDTWNFPFRPKSALTRIMRISKPHSCDNILAQTRNSTPSFRKSPNSRSVNNIVADKRSDGDSVSVSHFRDPISPYQCSPVLNVVSRNSSATGNSWPAETESGQSKPDVLVLSPSITSSRRSMGTLYSSPVSVHLRRSGQQITSASASATVSPSSRAFRSASPQCGPKAEPRPDRTPERCSPWRTSPLCRSSPRSTPRTPSRGVGPLSLPTPPSTAPTQKKVMISSMAVETVSRFDPPTRFASESNVTHLADLRASSSAESTPQRSQAAPRSRLRPRRRLELQLRSKRYQSSTSSSCVSSWESLDSNTSSQGYGSEVTSLQEESRLRRIANLNILSPISDKSGEQVSPVSDKDPEANVETSGGGSSAAVGEKGGGESAKQQKNSHDLSLHLNLQNPSCENATSLKSLRTPDIQQYLNVPWDMPKLKKKLQNRRKFCFSGQTSSPETSPKKTSLPKSPDVELIFSNDWNEANNNNEDTSVAGGEAVGQKPSPGEFSDLQLLRKGKDDEHSAPSISFQHQFQDQPDLELSAKVQGSDSGISMSSQEMKELLDVPWSMPKLKRNAWIRAKPRPGLELPISARRNDLISDTTCDQPATANPTKEQSSQAAVDRLSGSPDQAKATTEDDLSNLPFSMPKLERKLQEMKQRQDVNQNLSVNRPPPPPTTTTTLVLTSSCTTVFTTSNTLVLSIGTTQPPATSAPASTPPTAGSLADRGSAPGSPPPAGDGTVATAGQPETQLATGFKPVLKPLSFNQPIREKPQLSLPIGQPKPSSISLPSSGNRPGVLNLGGGVLKRRFAVPPMLQLSLASSVEVNTNLPLESQEWYHGILSKAEVENILRKREEGSYLVRVGGGVDGDYSLAIKSAKGFIHMRLSKVEEGFRLGEEDRLFSSVVDLVKHYSLNRLPIKGAEHLCLLTPATEELL